MKQNNDFLSRALDKVASAIWVLDSDLTHVKFINAPFRQFVALSDDFPEESITTELCIDRLAAVFGTEGEDLTARRASFHKLKDTPSFNTILPTADGRHIKLERIPDTEGDVVITFTDVTDLQNAIENARQAEIAKTDFIANMSHEIRTPMNGVVGMAQILSGTDLTEKQSKYVDVISRSGKALVTIINDVLDYSKLQSGKFSISAQPFNFSEMIDDVVTLMGHTARNKNLELVLHMPRRPNYKLVGDVGRFRQILINIVGNAIKFTTDGYVKLSVAIEDIQGAAKIYIAIEDTGIGIAQDKLSKIFNQFEQADNSTTRNYGGTGLGLAISRQLVEHMDGHISVASTEGTGSIFAFTADLPISDIEVKAPSPIEPLDHTPILVVDDIAVNLAVMKNQLETINAQPVCVDSGAKALAFLQDLAARGSAMPLVITDYQMPEMNGLEFIKAVRNDSAIAATPIMVLSSVNIEALKDEMGTLGVHHIYEKPCLTHDLHKAVFEVISDAKLKALQDITEQNTSATNAETSLPQRRKTRPKKRIVSVLVADDDEVNRMVFAEMLGHARVKVTLVNDGKQAVETFKGGIFDFVLMDIAMPIMDGVSATKEIRKHENKFGLVPTPIIAATAHAIKGDREKYLDAGMDDYISKPIDTDKLRHVLKKWARKHQADLRKAG